ncbi:hypothetical protein MSAN_01312500 [Mycena sanguinolenta]|uniref:Uncharacterized protein n=1 Tax=Mycena sanguinolenta TaxID=230812 RepID=A0A8H7D3A2_9AGAR|nr:hypothetical protein MSAN_01312500 [Mycena sanguinolenta]
MHLLWYILLSAANSVLAAQRNITVDDKSSSITYTGTGWHTMKSSLDVDSSVHTTCGEASDGSRATFSFTGVAIYYVFTPENCAPRTVIILDSGTPVTVTYDSSLVKDGLSVQWGMTNLANGPHTIVNTGDGADTFARLDAFIYTVDEPEEVASAPTSPSGSSPTTTTASGTGGSSTTAIVGASASSSSPASAMASGSEGSSIGAASSSGSSAASATASGPEGSSTGAKKGPSPTGILPATATISGSGGSSTGAKVGGAIGGVASIAALLAAWAAYHFLESSHSSGRPQSQIYISTPSSDITSWKATTRIIITLQPDNWHVAPKQPEPGFTPKGSTPHDLVVWKAVKFEGKDPVTVRLPANLGFGDVHEDEDNKGIIRNSLFSFAPLRTLVKRIDPPSWKHETFRRPKLEALVLAHNNVSHPLDFAIGTFHKTRKDQDFRPFLLIQNVQPGDFCIAPQCANLRVNAYIAKNIQERQRLDSDLFGVSSSSDFTILEGPAELPTEDKESEVVPLLKGSAVTAQPSEEYEELGTVPKPYLEDEDVEHAPKILSPPLLGKDGTLVSSLDQTTRWRLVKERGALKLEIVPVVGHKRGLVGECRAALRAFWGSHHGGYRSLSRVEMGKGDNEGRREGA